MGDKLGSMTGVPPVPRSSLVRANGAPRRLLIEGPDQAEKFEDGLSKLILAIVKLLFDVIERQATRRVEAGSLTDDQVERLGNALSDIRQRFAEMCVKFGFRLEDLDIPVNGLDAASGDQRSRPSLIDNDFSSTNKFGLTASSLVNIIDRIIEKRTTIAGDVRVSLAGVELIVLRLMASLEPVEVGMLPKSETSRQSGE